MIKKILSVFLSVTIVLTAAGCFAPTRPVEDDITVEWNVNGGTGSVESYTGKAADFKESDIPDGSGISKQSFSFGGWSVNAASAPMKNADIVTSIKTTVRKFYAIWQAISRFTVTFNTNGAGDIDAVTVESGKKFAAPDEPSKAPELFAGWFKEPEFINQWNFNSDVVTGDTVLYAKWAAVASLSIITPPEKTEYYAGMPFEETGMVVKATYDNGTSAVITNYSITPSGALTEANTTITVSYGGKTAAQSITVHAIALMSITLSVQPAYTSYKSGELFNTAGLTVTGHYSDSTSAVITSYDYAPKAALIPLNKSVTVTCGGRQAQINISVDRNDYSSKRGVSYNFDTVSNTTAKDMDLLWGGGINGIAWHYNWGNGPSTATVNTASTERGLDYFPMAWKDYNANTIRAYKAAHPECEYLLAFNEPNLTDQANLTPAQAASRWPALKALAAELNMKLVSPAMNSGTLSGYSDPVVWLDEFFAQPNVSINDISAISVHCYMDYPSAFKSFIEKFKKYGKPIWMTEFCAWEDQNNNLTNNKWRWQARHMSDTMSYMELDPDVARYAWFIPKGTSDENTHPYNKLLTNGATPSLTELGKVYTNMSVCDKSVYQPAGRKIDASQYTDCNVSDWINVSGFRNTVNSRPTDDTDTEGGVLEIHNFTANGSTPTEKWVEYQIDLAQTGNYNLSIRNNTAQATVIAVIVDGVSKGNITLSAGGGWQLDTAGIGALASGKHTIRLKCLSGGDCAINWLRVDKV